MGHRFGQRFDGDELGGAGAAGYSEALAEEREQRVTVEPSGTIIEVDTDQDSIHVFERAGLGKAPFRCVDVVARVGPIQLGNGMMVGAPGQPMGTCKFCGNGIKDCYVIESADGNHFDVGCECVRKTGDAGLKKVVARHVAEKRKAQRAAQIKREQVRIEAARIALADDPEVREHFAARQHPNKWRADQGDTGADYLDFMLTQAGHTGMMRATRTIEKFQKSRA